MALMKTSNPALNVNSFRVDQAVSGEAMTLTGTVNKTGVLLICVVATAAWSWSRFFHARTSDAVLPLMGIGLDVYKRQLVCRCTRRLSRRCWRGVGNRRTTRTLTSVRQSDHDGKETAEQQFRSAGLSPSGVDQSGTHSARLARTASLGSHVVS